MNETTNIKMELEPHLQRMLNAYGSVPVRDPIIARRNREMFMAKINTALYKQPATESSLNRLWQGFYIAVGRRLIPYVLTTLVVITAFLFGSVGITAYAASSSLPGDALYSLKTTFEKVQAQFTVEPEAQARLYLDFARRRLSEIQALVDEQRYMDIAQAIGEFEKDIQKSLSAVETLSKTDPARAIELNAEIAAVLRSYADLLSQMLAVIPDDVQQTIQNAINASQSADGDDDDDSSSVGTDDDEVGNDDEDGSSPSPSPSTVTATPILPTMTPTPASSATPAPVPVGGDGGNGNNNNNGNDDDDDDGDDDGDDGDDDGDDD